MINSPKKLTRYLRNRKGINKLSNSEIRLIILIVFPIKDADLDGYFNNARAYLTTASVQTRLHVDADKFATLNGLMGGDRTFTASPPNTNGTPDSWNYVYPLEKSKATFTHPLKTWKDKLAVKIKAAFMDIFSDIPDSAIKQVDTDNLFIKPKSQRKKRTNTPTQITEKAYPMLIPLGGGQMRVLTHKEKKSKRGAKLNRRVEIEIIWILVERNDKITVLPSDCPNKQVISTANFVLNLGAEAGGMRLVLFARWIYVKHPKQSGGFGTGANNIVT
jgi:hypothetical protein